MTHPPHTPLTHVDDAGKARMVNVADKPITHRRATAEGFVRINADLERAIRDNTLAKGDALGVARLAAILAAKRTDELIPLCHTLPLDAVEVDIAVERGRIRITATVVTQARTGVEMEALLAVSIAALTIIDMGKSIDREMTVDGIRILEKHGGRSGSHVTAPGP